jgi:hypothetical protein
LLGGYGLEVHRIGRGIGMHRTGSQGS